jgi:anti-sigma B factor antagonist
VCAAAGEVDSATAPMLCEQLCQAIRERPRHLVVDLAAVTFFSAAGVGALHTARAAQYGDQHLVLVGTGRPVVRVLDICQVAYPRYRELDQALAACDETNSA